MSEPVTLAGIVLLSAPSREYDRRVVLLTRERGKITAFARGARRQGSPLLGVTLPCCFGRFRLFEGREAYTLASAEIDFHFSGLREDLDGSGYAFYFLELADYYGRENLEAADMLNLLYLALRALESRRFQNRLVRYIYEIRLMVVNGEYPLEEVLSLGLSETAGYMISYIATSTLRKLFTFTVSDEVLEEVARAQDRVRSRWVDKRLKSLEFLELTQAH